MVYQHTHAFTSVEEIKDCADMITAEFGEKMGNRIRSLSVGATTSYIGLSTQKGGGGETRMEQYNHAHIVSSRSLLRNARYVNSTSAASDS
jgi:hypothetical protein